MRLIITLLFAFTSLLFIESCGSSNSVYSKSILQKRKYTKGRFFKGHFVKPDSNKNIQSQQNRDTKRTGAAPISIISSNDTSTINDETESILTHNENKQQTERSFIEQTDHRRKVNAIQLPQKKLIAALNQLKPKKPAITALEAQNKSKKSAYIFLITAVVLLIATIILIALASGNFVYIFLAIFLFAGAVLNFILSIIYAAIATKQKKQLSETEKEETSKFRKKTASFLKNYKVIGWLTVVILALGLSFMFSTSILGPIGTVLFLLGIILGIITLVMRSKYKKNKEGI